jgi:hypothetical protein
MTVKYIEEESSENAKIWNSENIKFRLFDSQTSIWRRQIIV